MKKELLVGILGAGALLADSAWAEVTPKLKGQETAKGSFMNSWLLQVETIEEAPFALATIKIERIGDPEGKKQPANEVWEKLIYRPMAGEFRKEVKEEVKVGPRPRLKKTDRYRISTQLTAFGEVFETDLEYCASSSGGAKVGIGEKRMGSASKTLVYTTMEGLDDPKIKKEKKLKVTFSLRSLTERRARDKAKSYGLPLRPLGDKAWSLELKREDTPEEERSSEGS